MFFLFWPFFLFTFFEGVLSRNSTFSLFSRGIWVKFPLFGIYQIFSIWVFKIQIEGNYNLNTEKSENNSKIKTTETGFEPMRDQPMGTQIPRLNHSAILPWHLLSNFRLSLKSQQKNIVDSSKKSDEYNIFVIYHLVIIKTLDSREANLFLVDFFIFFK